MAALASWLDARSAGGAWLVRVEDADRPRCPPGVGALVLGQLAQCGLHPDEPPWWQSQRDTAYAAALQQLLARGQAYACGCTRREIEGALAVQGQVQERGQDLVYPGTCRNGLHGKPARAMRFRVPDACPPLQWHDRRLGPQQQDVAADVGDFVLRRADGLWAYQLAVVVDDAAQDITHVVRGEDLADNTPRQLLLQRALQHTAPVYLHTPLVHAADGHKLSKQNGAAALDLRDPQAALDAAARVLGLAVPAAPTLPEWLAQAVVAWGHRWPAAAGAGQ